MTRAQNEFVCGFQARQNRQVTQNLFHWLMPHRLISSDTGAKPFLRVPAPAGNIDHVLSWADVDDRSAQFAGALVRFGVAAGDRVLVQVHKSTDAVALYLACLRIGAVFVTVNTAYTDAEVTYFARDSQPTLVVRSPDRSTFDDVACVTLAPGDPAAGPNDATSPSPSLERSGEGEPFRDVVHRAATDVAALLYTSGTTGRSKGAMLTHGSLLANGRALHEIWGFEPGDVLLHALPVFHVHGLFIALQPAMLNQSEVVFLPRFDASQVIAHLPASTVFMGVPTFYTRLMDDPAFGPEVAHHMRLFTSGSAPMTELVHQAFEARTGQRILERYGMTETGIITSNPLNGDRIAGTVGFALPQTRIRITDDDGSPTAAGTTGIVEMQGEGLFAGYWDMPDKTQAAFNHGWFTTGDVGSVDQNGRLTLEGRAGDMIISGGLNIYPKEIEVMIDSLPGVVESAVVGLPHNDLGEATAAFVVLEPGRKWNDPMAEVSAGLADHLARFKVPKMVVVIPELPRNAMAKVQKVALRAEYESAFTESAFTGT